MPDSTIMYTNSEVAEKKAEKNKLPIGIKSIATVKTTENTRPMYMLSTFD